jgi:hypothetical protein
VIAILTNRVCDWVVNCDESVTGETVIPTLVELFPEESKKIHLVD